MPTLLFFRDVPRDLLSHPPLASSLQNLETSFLLLTMSRYPSALVSAASAIESLVQAAFPNLRRKRFEVLLEHANSRFPVRIRFPKEDLHEFRKKRNDIIHFGFNRSNDEEAAALLLRTGYPFIEQCYEIYFDFRLKRLGADYGGLLPNFDRHLEIGQIVYQRTRQCENVRAISCFIPLAHEIRWRIRDSMLSNWEAEVLQDEDEQFERRFELQEREKRKLRWDQFQISWEFDCPICDYPEALVCELDHEALEKREIHLDRAICVSCGLVIPKNCPTLADELCADQLVEARPRILEDFSLQ
jgi:hypothetical protein